MGPGRTGDVLPPGAVLLGGKNRTRGWGREYEGKTARHIPNGLVRARAVLEASGDSCYSLDEQFRVPWRLCANAKARSLRRVWKAGIIANKLATTFLPPAPQPVSYIPGSCARGFRAGQ